MSTLASRFQVPERGLARYTGTLSRETALFLMAAEVVGVTPSPGTSAGDHLASGLIPIAVQACVCP
jgi:hypothetical protein